MKANHEISADLEKVLTSLLDATQASRTTLRIDIPERDFNVNVPVAEARTPGVKSLKSESSLDQRAAETVKWLERERRTLVQNDVYTDGPSPPQALIDIYGTRAQMLSPLFEEDHLAGWISVHQSGSTRQWKPKDVAALEGAIDAVRRILQEPE